MYGSTQGFSIGLELYSGTMLDAGVYPVDGDPDGIYGFLSGVSTDGDNFFEVTGGSVTLSIDSDVYSITMDLTTSSGDLTGSYTFPTE